MLKYCQGFLQLSMGQPLTDTDENFFSSQNLTAEDVRGCEKELFLIIKLLLEICQLGTVESLLKILPSNNHTTMYFVMFACYIESFAS